MFKGRAEWSAFLVMQERSDNFKMERLVRLKDVDRSFDVEYWQRLGQKAIFDEAWKMVLAVHCPNGGELRVQRTVESFRRLRG
jgi:hypothetical protein